MENRYPVEIAIDTHTHTLVSGHAYNTIREMAQMAADKGLKALAITEHAPKMPGSTNPYYFQNLKVVPRELYGVEMLFGVELNILNRTGEMDLDADTVKGLDLSIASVHTICYEDEWNLYSVMGAYEGAMRNPCVDIIGHPDDGRFPVDYGELARIAKETGTLLELNNASQSPNGFRINTKNNALKMLAACKQQGAMIVIGSDAHVDVALGEFPHVWDVLKMAEFPAELIANTSVEKLKGCLKRNQQSRM